LARHLEDCSAYKKQKPTSQSSITDFSGCVTSKRVEEDLVIKTLKFFISGNIAFNQADNPYFQELIRAAAAQGIAKIQPINRKNVRDKLHDVASDAKEDLMVSLMENKSKVSLALDCWSSGNNYAFLGTSLFIS